MSRARIVRRVPAPRDLRIGSLPTALPIFPLGGALLLPRGRLPLNIFEPRYQALVEDALSGDRLFGMIQPSDGLDEQDSVAAAALRGARADTPTALFRFGCVGRITSFSERQDGSCSLTLTGIARFRMLGETETDRPYRILSVSYDGFAGDLEEADAVDFDRPALMGALRRYFDHRGFEARWEAVEQMDDDTLLTTLGMICPFPPAEKQALLEAASLSDRAATLQTLLEMGNHESDDEGGRPHAV